MNEQDKKISRLYKETYGNVHASEDLKGKVTDMKNKNNRKAKVIKLVCGVAAAAVALTVGTIAVSASRTKYDKIFVNGEEKNARFIDFGINTRMWECECNGTGYSIYVHGDFDMEKDTLYLIDCGDYFLASTDPNPTLNLYQDIDKSSFAEIKKEDNETYLYVTDDAGTMKITMTADEEDGTADGRIEREDGSDEVFALLPNGAVVNTMKYGYTPVVDDVMRLFGHDRDSFWNNLYEQVESYQPNQ